MSPFLSLWAVWSTAPTLTLYKDIHICETVEVSGREKDSLLVPESGGGGSVPMSWTFTLSENCIHAHTMVFKSFKCLEIYIYIHINGCVPKMGRFLSLQDDLHMTVDRLADLFKLMMYLETYTGNAESESGSLCSVNAVKFDKTLKEPSISACGRRLRQTRVLFRCVPAAYSQYF